MASEAADVWRRLLNKIRKMLQRGDARRRNQQVVAKAERSVQVRVCPTPTAHEPIPITV